MPLTIHVYGKPVLITDATIAATRRHFADLCIACAEGAEQGNFFCNDPARYAANERAKAQRYLAGDHGRMSATFVQRAYWLQSGQCVGLLA